MKIGSPKDLKGNALLTGISAVSGTTNIGSDFKTIKNGSNVTLTSSAGGILVVAAGGAIAKPATNGTAGQVLKTSGGTGAAYWGDALSTVAWSDVQSKPAVVSALPATSGANGQILRAGANGTIAWENVSTTVVSGNSNAVTGGAVFNAVSSHENNGTHLPATGTSGYIAVKDTTGYKLVQKLPWSVISGAPSFITISAVNSLPTTGIQSNVIYLVPNSGTGSNVKDEYIYQNSKWELIGTTEVDLSNFDSHISSAVIHVPNTNTGSNGQVLKIVNGTPAWGNDLTADGSAVLPAYDSANGGQILQVKADGTGTQWAAAATGDMTKAEYVTGSSAVKSAVYATKAGSATRVAGTEVVGTVSSATYATKAGSATYVSGTEVNGAVASATYATKAGSATYVSGTEVNGAVASATYATTAGTANGVAGNKVTGTVGSATYATTAGTATTMTGIANYVQKTTTVNGKNMSANITLYGSDINIDSSAGALTVSSAITSLATVVGSKGEGDMKASVYVSATGTGVVKSATYATTAGTANSVAGANVTGTVGSATYATTAGTANGVAGNKVTGTVGSATYATKAGSATYVSGTEVHGTVDSATYATTAGSATYVSGTEVNGAVASATYATTAGTANGVAGNKVTGTVGSATYATTAGAVNGTVASATYATKAGSATYVSGTEVNGAVASATKAGSATYVSGTEVHGTVDSASYATKAGSATYVSATEVHGTVASATYATKAGSVDKYESHISSAAIHVPSTANIDNGKVLKKTSNGVEWATDLTADGSAILPQYDATANGKFLQVVSNGTAVEWVTAAAGDMTKAEYVSANGTGVVKSATYATTAGTANGVAGNKVTGTVSSATYATTAGTANGVAGANVTGTVSSATYATTAGTANAVAGAKVTGTVSSATYATTAGGVAGANVNGTVASATYATTAGTANNVKNTTITISQGGTSKGSFTLNQATAGTINLDAVKVSGTAITSIAAGGNVTLSVATNTVTISATDTTPNDKTVQFYAGASATSNSCGQITLNQNADSNIIIQSATTTRFGVVKVGTGLGITNGVLSATVSNAVTSNGSNPVAGSAIYSHVTSGLAAKVGYDEMAHVAFTGDYNDLVNVPSAFSITASSGSVTSLVAGSNITFTRTNSVLTIAATGGGGAVSNAVTSDGTSAVAGSAIYSHVESKTVNKVDYEDLAKVAFTGDYNDLISKPLGGNSGNAGFMVSGSTVTSMAAGTNVTLTVAGSTVTISATGGGGGNITIDNTITQNGANPVAGSAIWSAISAIGYELSQL